MARVAIVGPLAYLWLILVLRTSGKRTLAQLNAFDFIVTVALGSTLATIILSNSVAWAEGALVLALLAVLQLVGTWASTRAPWVRRALTSSAIVLCRDGVILHEAMTAERVTEQSLHQAVRSAGIGGMELVAAVVLETNGTVSVISVNQRGSGSAMPQLQMERS